MADAEHRLRLVTEFEDNSTDGLKKSQASILSFTDAVEKASKRLEESFRKQKKGGEEASKGLLDSFKSLKASTVAAAAGVAGLVAVIGKVVAEITEAEDVAKRFSFALKTSGINSQDAVGRFKNFAAAIQSTSKYSDEAIISLGTLLTSSGIGFKDLETASKAAVELSSRYGKSLDESGQLVIRSFMGQTRELKFLVPGIENLTEAQLRAGEGAKLISSVLGGSAETEKGTLAGTLASVKNAVSDLSESLVVLFGPAIEAASSFVKALTENVNIFSSALAGISSSTKGTKLEQFKGQLEELKATIEDTVNTADNVNLSGNERLQAEKELHSLFIEERNLKRDIAAMESGVTIEINKQVKGQEEVKKSMAAQLLFKEKQKKLIEETRSFDESLFKNTGDELQKIKNEAQLRKNKAREFYDYRADLDGQYLEHLKKRLLESSEIEKKEIKKVLDDRLDLELDNIDKAYKAKKESEANITKKISSTTDFINMAGSNPLQAVTSAAGAGIGSLIGGPFGAQIGEQIGGQIPKLIESTKAIFSTMSTFFGGLFDDPPAFYNSLSDAIADKMDKTAFAMALRDLSFNISGVGDPYRTDKSNLSRAKENLSDKAGRVNTKDLFNSIMFRSSDFSRTFLRTGVEKSGTARDNMIQTGFEGTLKQAIEQGVNLKGGTVRVTDKFKDALKGIGEQLAEEAKAIKEYTDLRIKELERLKSARESAKGVFQGAIESVRGALISPTDTVDMLTGKFKGANGEKKADIGLQLAGALQNRFTAAQQLASQGAISGEELQRIQAQVLAQLGDVQSKSLSEFDKLIQKQEDIKNAALKQIDYLASIDKAIKSNNIQHLINFFKNAPKFAEGTDYVSKTGFAMVHQGEQIIPKGGSGGGGLVININGVSGGSNMKDEIARSVRDVLKSNNSNLRGYISRVGK